MGIELVLPRMNEKEMTTKDLVINILTHTWPLSARKIYNKIKKEYNFDVTYQAVHKTLKQLLDKDVLIREGNRYQLSEEWINKIEKFGSTIKTRYKTGQRQRVEDLIKRDFVSLSFDTLKEFAEFCVPVFVVQYPKQENKIGVCNFYHIYPLVGFSDKVYKNMKDFFSKYKFHSLCKHDTPLDRWFAEFFRKVGKKVKTGVNFSNDYDTIVVGDYVMQVFFAKEIRDKIDDLYKKIKNVEEVSLDELLSCILEKRAEINVVIFKNPKIADQIREDTLKYFKKRKN